MNQQEFALGSRTIWQLVHGQFAKLPYRGPGILGYISYSLDSTYTEMC